MDVFHGGKSSKHNYDDCGRMEEYPRSSKYICFLRWILHTERGTRGSVSNGSRARMPDFAMVLLAPGCAVR